MAAQFVVDASIVLAWCFEDEEDHYADAVLDSLHDKRAVVPAIWPLEVGNALLAAERRRRLSEAAVIRFLSLVRGMPIEVEQESPERMLREIVALGREHGLSTYDASYLDLAMRRGLPLATRDALLTKAARRCQIPLFVPARRQR